MIALCPSCIMHSTSSTMCLNDISSVLTGRISAKIDRIILLEVLYQNCSNRSALLYKMATRTKNRKYFKRHLLCNLGRLQSNMTGLILRKSSIKIAQIVPLCCTKWPPELKLEDLLTSGQISTKVDRIILLEVLLQNSSNHSGLLHKMATRAKNRKYFKGHHVCNSWADFNQT